MSFKAKTVLNKDVRVFKQDIDSMEQGLEAIKKFIQEKYEIKGGFIIQYEDEEKDLITIATSEDLEEAYDQAEANGSVLKLLIVPEDSSVPVYELTSELDKSQVNDQGVNTSSSDEEEEEKKENNNNEESCIGKKLLQDLINNKEFRQEFINFITNLITLLKQEIPNVSNQAFQQVLSQHENIAKHPSLIKLNEKLPQLLNTFIGAIDVENIGTWINSIIEMLSLFNLDGSDGNCFMNAHHGGMGPNILMQLLGGFPFGVHMPPPPPPPSHYGHFYQGYNYSFPHPPPPPPPSPFHILHSWLNGNFGSFVPPPPPPPPHAFGGAHPFGFPPHPHGHRPHCHRGGRHGFGSRGGRHGHGHGPARHCRRQPHAHPFEHPHHDNNFEEMNDQSPHHPHPPCHGFGPFGPLGPLGPLEMLFGGSNGPCGGSGSGKGWKKYCKQMNKEWKPESKENNEYSVEILNDSITLADKAYVLPQQVIIKTWQVKNNGKKDWPQGMKLKYFGPTFNPIINGVEFNVPELKINEQADISVIIEIPKLDENIKNKQKAKFRLCLPNNNGFIGPIFKVRVFIINNEEQQEQQPSLLKEEEKEEKKDQDHNVNDVIEKLKENHSSPSSFADVHVPKIEDLNIDDDLDILSEPIAPKVEKPVVVEQVKAENKPILESNLIASKKEEEKPYIYENQLNVILNMGFDNVEKIRGLLDAAKGDINVVIGQLFA